MVNVKTLVVPHETDPNERNYRSEMATNDPGPSTSDPGPSKQNLAPGPECDTCSYCKNNPVKEKLRLIINKRSLQIIHMVIQASVLILKPLNCVSSPVWDSDCSCSCSEVDSRDDSEVLATFVERLADSIGIEVYRIKTIIDNVMTLSNRMILDLDMKKLNRFVEKEKEIEDIITRTFCYSSIPSISSIAFSLTKSIDDVAIQDDFCCPYTLKMSAKRMITWYIEEFFFYDNDTLHLRKGFGEFLRRYRSRSREIKNSLVTDNIQRGSISDPTQAYLTDYTKIMDLLANTFINIKRNLPFIIRIFEDRSRNHVFYMVHNVHLTYEQLYSLLSLMRDILNRMNLKSIVLYKLHYRYTRLNPFVVQQMVKFVFEDTHIKVIIPCPKSNQLCCIK